MIHFVYIWMDKVRKMFYVGSHSGSIDDGYVSSSRWLNYEIRYRPTDFKRRIIKIFATRSEAQQYEMFLLSLVTYSQFGVKYYNLKTGKPRGSVAWNKGKTGMYTDDRLSSQSQKMMGNKSNTGKPQPHAADNGRRGAAKLAAKAKGRRRVTRDGKVTWAYPTDSDYPG